MPTFGTSIENHPDFPGIKRFVDGDLEALIMKAAAGVPKDSHVMIVPFANGEKGEFAAVIRINDNLSAMGVFQHTWDTGANDWEVGGVITF